MTSFDLALITGTTSGIGTALAHLLKEKKIPLFLSGRNCQTLEQIGKEISPEYALGADLLKKEDRERLIQMIHLHYPNLIINNAGACWYGQAISRTTQEELDVLELNANAVLELTLEAAKSLIEKQKKGIILNVASVSAFYSLPGMAVYAAAKTFIVNVSQALDFELKPYGVRVLVACPGMVDTQFRMRASKSSQPSRDNYMVMTAEQAAQHIWWQIEKQKRCYVFDWRYRLSTWLSKLTAKEILMDKLYKRILKRIN